MPLVGAPWLPGVRPVGELVGVESIVHAHWREYGRNYYTRYDYEEVPTPPSQAEAHIIVNGTLARQVDAEMANMLVARLLDYGEEFKAAGFGPERPKARALLLSLDAPCLRKSSRICVHLDSQVRLLFADGSRIIFRLSGTGSVGATVRMYIEKYQPPDDEDALMMDVAEALEPLVELALDFAQVREFTGRDEPTVIT
ncbi:MAG: hypothetical protein SGPRY_004251 [Prymnesium sp.]